MNAMSVITSVVAVFSVLGAADYLLGNKFGLGKEFEKAFSLLGTLALTMVGMLVLAPQLAHWMSPVLTLLAERTAFEPSVIAGMLLACDMGGASLAVEIAASPESGYYNGLVVSSMMGTTISFTLPLALGVTKKEQHRSIMLGLMSGIIAIPVGCLVSGLMLGLSASALLANMLPLTVFAVLISVGLLKLPDLCLKVFQVLGQAIKIIIILGLMAGLFTFLTGIPVLPHAEPAENSMRILFNAVAVMSGMFPLLHLLGKLIDRPLKRFGQLLGVNDASALGLLASLATNVTTFGMMERMDDKGVVFNSAFAVSAAFCFAGHLAFTMSFEASYLPAVITGKLISGVASLVVAGVVYKKVALPAAAKGQQV